MNSEWSQPIQRRKVTVRSRLNKATKDKIDETFYETIDHLILIYCMSLKIPLTNCLLKSTHLRLPKIDKLNQSIKRNDLTMDAGGYNFSLFVELDKLRSILSFIVKNV